jgi:hypothetical protein
MVGEFGNLEYWPHFAICCDARLFLSLVPMELLHDVGRYRRRWLRGLEPDWLHAEVAFLKLLPAATRAQIIPANLHIWW